jgi:hypothetical protein
LSALIRAGWMVEGQPERGRKLTQNHRK